MQYSPVHKPHHRSWNFACLCTQIVKGLHLWESKIFDSFVCLGACEKEGLSVTAIYWGYIPYMRLHVIIGLALFCVSFRFRSKTICSNLIWIWLILKFSNPNPIWAIIGLIWYNSKLFIVFDLLNVFLYFNLFAKLSKPFINKIYNIIFYVVYKWSKKLLIKTL